MSYWLKAMPRVVERLESKSGADVLDVGCGAGRAVVVLAEAFPSSRFVGIDLDAASIGQAEHAAGHIAERVVFRTQSIQDMDEQEKFDLIMACDCVHDFAQPVETLTAIRQRLKPDGTFFVIEPKAADRLEDNKHSVGTMFYGYSVFHCMTQSLANGGPGLGTCMGPARTEALMREAGFTEFEKLDVKSQVNLFYAVR